MSSADSHEPIWARSEPGARRPAHTRQRIVQTAIAIADAEGLKAVSMRRLAAELGAGTMTLYHYVRTKDELIVLIDDAIMGELVVPDDELPEGWREAFAAIARRTRDASLRHPWICTLQQKGDTGPNAMRHVEQSLEAASRTGLDTAAQLELIMLLDDYVFGYVARLAQQQQAEAPERAPELEQRVTAIVAYLDAQLATGDYPRLRAFAGDDTRAAFGGMVEIASDDERFERGLTCLLDGIALDVERRRQL